MKICVIYVVVWITLSTKNLVCCAQKNLVEVQTRIQELRLEYNKLVVLSGSLSGLIGLKKLNVSHNCIERILSDDLIGLDDLKIFDISFNDLTSLNDTFKAKFILMFTHPYTLSFTIFCKNKSSIVRLSVPHKNNYCFVCSFTYRHSTLYLLEIFLKYSINYSGCRIKWSGLILWTLKNWNWCWWWLFMKHFTKLMRES